MNLTLSIAAVFVFSANASAAGLPQPLRSPAAGLSADVAKKIELTTTVMHNKTEGSYCTVFPVSQDGYLLTALHCVRSCLEMQGLVEKTNNAFIGLRDLSVMTRSSQTNAFCKDHVIPYLGANGVTVVSTGVAFADFDAKFLAAFPSLFNELKAVGFDSRANDYALLKIQPKFGPLSCLKISTQPLARGQKLWAIGYPLPDTDTAPVLSASPGRVYANAQESLHFKAQKTESGRRLVETLYNNDGVIFSDSHNHFGQSGGPVIGQDGTVIGVTSGFENVSTPSGQVHELVAGSMEKILKSLPQPLAQTLIQASQSCL